MVVLIAWGVAAVGLLIVVGQLLWGDVGPLSTHVPGLAGQNLNNAVVDRLLGFTVELSVMVLAVLSGTVGRVSVGGAAWAT